MMRVKNSWEWPTKAMGLALGVLLPATPVFGAKIGRLVKLVKADGEEFRNSGS